MSQSCMKLNRSNSKGCDRNVLQKKLLAGRYRIGSLLPNFSPSCSGLCELCGEEPEDLSHILLPRCRLLQERKEALMQYWRTVLKQSPTTSVLVENILASNDDEKFLKLLLDCSALPEVTLATEDDATVLPLLSKITRTWCYSLLRTRMKILGRWN
eukprot:TRINITY_DN17719_c0_g1_i2.p1 TRINITY_DN17719_c0_g1~~TRINITY_DN17719_c0_g1_i2.p1  ORF type:complete len:156 (-),score=37.46 TRINITY_DN17719_c0_g1_i2:42-509(-)